MKAAALSLALGAALATGPAALACSTCYGAAQGSMIDGARLGIWLLLGVTAVVQGSFAAFFIYLWRRARQAARAREAGVLEAS